MSASERSDQSSQSGRSHFYRPNIGESHFGDFHKENDLKKLRGPLYYNVDVHKLGGQQVHGLRDDLHTPDVGAVSVRVFREAGPDGEKQTVGSEWVYSDDEGTVERLNTGAWSPEAPHYGADGKKIIVPGVDD